jgi:HlyD family secretion protein
MKRSIRWLIILLVLVGIPAAAARPLQEYWKKRTAPKWRLAEVVEGRIVMVVNATGAIEPVRKLTVGAFVSGPVDTQIPMADFNQEVKKGDVLCRIDARIYSANLTRDQATLASRVAELERAQAQYEQAQRDLDRAVRLKEQDKTFISQAEMDKFYFSVKSLAAQMGVAQAAIDVAKSQVEFSVLQVDYCDIVAPEAGIVINRKIHPGQTLASQFQTPELFVIAPNMRNRIDVHASVDEADIGLIRRAQERNLPASFTVDAYSEELFKGKIEEVRMNSTTTQNVVTYPVIVSTENLDLKLLPGMTASLSFQVDEREGVIKIPNAALRYYPLAKHVRESDRKLVEGTEVAAESEDETTSDKSLSAEERNALRKQRNRRHVWAVEGDFLKAIEVFTGLSDSQYTEMVSGDLKPGDSLVTGILLPTGSP